MKAKNRSGHGLTGRSGCYSPAQIICYVLGYICYDDGCHLKKYAENQSQHDLMPTTKVLCKLSIIIDKMHMDGHIDAWCKKYCDPNGFPELSKVQHNYCK